MKRTPANLKTEKLGLLAIESTFNAWGWVWRPTPPPDTGIDGTVEVVEGASAATGQLLAVQSKAGRSYFKNETEATFEFHAHADDVAYWAGYSQPVVLAVYDPTLRQLFAISIKDYLRDKPEARTSPFRFIFHKEADLVQDGARSWLRSVAFGAERSYTTRHPVTVQEVLHTNLLPVLTMPIGLYSAERLESGATPLQVEGAVTLEQESRVWCLHDPMLVSGGLRDLIRTTSVRFVPWSAAVADDKLQGYCFTLLYRALRQHLRGLPIAFDKARKRHYFHPKSKEDGTCEARSWEYQSVRRRTTRKVAHHLSGKYWAHHAVKLTWELHGERLFLKLVPAYVFTDGGTAVQADEDVVRLNVKKRRLEYNRQVFQHLVFWREVLARGATQIQVATGGEPLLLDKAFVSQQVNFGIYDDRQSFKTIAEPSEEALDETAFISDDEANPEDDLNEPEDSEAG